MKSRLSEKAAFLASQHVGRGAPQPVVATTKTKQQKPKKSKTDVALPDRSVSMSNALARGSHALSLSEKRVVALAVSA
jgi:hypothetical protein